MGKSEDDFKKKVAKYNLAGYGFKYRVDEYERTLLTVSQRRDKIEVLDSTTCIGTCCFSNTHAREIILPDTVTEMETASFADCNDLVSVRLSSNLEIIPISCFNSCEKLEKIVIPDNVNYIGLVAFFNCKSLTELSLPAKLRKVGSSAFSGCASLKVLVIPQGVEEIKENAFLMCNSLHLVLPEKFRGTDFLGIKSECVKYY